MTIYGLTADDPEIFHVLDTGGPEKLAALIRREPASVSSRMRASGEAPLMIAARLGKSDLVALLLDAGAPLNDTTRAGETALHCAVVGKSEHVVSQLLRAGADVSAARSGGDTPLHLAATFCRNPAILGSLLEAGAAVEARRYNGSTPAIMAAFSGNIECLKALAAHGADIAGARCETNTGGPFDNCLTIAAEKGHDELLDYLLASFSWSAEARNAALKLAAGEGHPGCVRALVSHGADPFAPAGANKKSAIGCARQKKQNEIVDFFESLRR